MAARVTRPVIIDNRQVHRSVRPRWPVQRERLKDRYLQTHAQCNMITSSNGNIFRVTGHLCGEFTGPR